ncbi:MAG: hypothetical protein U1F20_00300 [Lysobacterales bacterium]
MQIEDFASLIPERLLGEYGKGFLFGRKNGVFEGGAHLPVGCEIRALFLQATWCSSGLPGEKAKYIAEENCFIVVELAGKCQPVHQSHTVSSLSNSLLRQHCGKYVRMRLGAAKLASTLVERNTRKWRPNLTPDATNVVSATHPSLPTDAVQR